MYNDDAPYLIYAIMLLVLMASGLIARRLPMKQYAKMIAAWAGIFAVAFVIMSFRPEMSMAWERIKGELTGAPRQSSDEQGIRLVRQDDGHFWLRAAINNQNVDFMVDSGATTTAINANTARQIGLKADSSKLPIELETANGRISVASATVPSIVVGEYQVDEHDVVISDKFGDTNVVGMNFLDSFGSWSVTGDVMQLKP
ncbi:TIGR02281 family clan AA aspartic protease [Sphingorhabdus pulchriflava]|uniref:TIGR02281 family clan AA aspartic protease n=1 Tax=Sphingorhabdus pulchriflava TaxID=2292257 RepID=A0A371BH21_9SPHN|nr:TIGR02281 family clan AA aspartic protease [Sphingorhabdus pulchriflava]RDV06848.1 TIGR02281 family clan AA aspartic protease [Sphingorhabdus pulchriflava]